MKEKFKDTDLREALRRNFANVPEMPMSLTPNPSPRREGDNFRTRFSALHGKGLGWVSLAASIVIAFVLWPDSPAVVEQPVEQQPVVAEVVEQPVPEVSDISEASATSKPAEPVKRHRAKAKPLLAQAETVPEEPVISTPAEEPVTEYQRVQVIRAADDQVVFIVQTTDEPTMPDMPSVGELRARGQQLLANVQQQLNASKQF